MKLLKAIREFEAALRSKPKLVAALATVLNFVIFGSLLVCTVAAAEEAAAPVTIDTSWAFIAAAVTVAGACAAASFAIYAAATAGSAAMVEKPELAIWVLVLGGLGEGLAIYGFVIAIVILGKI